MTEETIFHEALSKGTPGERAAYLEQACAEQPELHAGVIELLAAHEATSHFLVSPINSHNLINSSTFQMI